MLFDRTHRSQLYATVVASLIAFGYGISQGWPSPVLPLLQSPNTPFRVPLTIEEISWIAAISQIGGMLGTPIFGWSAEKFGRKNTLLASALPQIISWIIVEFSSSAFHLYVARFLVGFGGTGLYVVIPCYVAEISSNDVRGTLGSIMMVLKNFGIVVGYTINSYLVYHTAPLIVTAILVTFLIGFGFVADSPQHLMTQNKPDEAVAALKYFRGYKKSDQMFSKEFEDELAGLKNCGQSTEKFKDEKLTANDFCSKSAIMSILIGLFLMYLEVNGYMAIQNYSETIFRDAGSTLSPALSTVLLGVILLVGSYSSTLLVEKAGRKILMIISATGCGISLSTIAAYSYLKERGFDVTPYSWVTLLFLSSFILLGSMGVFSLHTVIISEVLAQKIRGVVMTVLVFENWTLSFLTVKYFPILLGIIGMHGCMFIFAITCFAGAMFVLLVIPETKGKSIEDIVKELSGKNRKNVQEQKT